ncbi:MAG TPA: hypothetical protein VLR69_01970 [Thermoanaerobaculia bacterium]|nr:hypothetical protein [Thermoanaerobaculia bacterium]
MREFSKSLFSFSWAMSMLGVEQMANLASPRRAADAFGTVARSAEGALGPGLRSVFQTGDRLQRTMVDLSFGMVGMGPARDGTSAAPAAGTPGLLGQVGNLAFDFVQMGVDAVYSVTGAAWSQQQGLSGWGPVPPPPSPPGAGTRTA